LPDGAGESTDRRPVDSRSRSRANRGRLIDMNLEPWDFTDVDRLMHEIATRVELAEDTAYVGVVRRPSSEQHLVDVRRLDSPALVDDDDDLSDELRAAAESFRIPDTGECLHAFVTLLVRPGRCVVGPNEAVWLNGWRYANHVQRAFSGELVLVTEHGWVAWPSDAAGHQPRMQSACIA